MFLKIELYIQNIQKSNWGFPWHIFFANVLFHLFFPVFMFTFLNYDQGIIWASIVSFVLINIIGLCNEIINTGDKTEFWQDVIGNNIGVLIAFIQWIVIIKLME